MKMIAAVTLLLCAFVHAVTYVVPLRDLKFENKTEKLTKLLDGQKAYNRWTLRFEPNMSARTPDGVMAYLAPETVEGAKRRDSLIAVELAEDKKFTAQLDIPIGKGYDLDVSSFKFSFDPKNYKPAAKEEVERIKKTHYHLLTKYGYVGSPWFNEMAGEIEFGRPVLNVNNVRTDFSLYTGGRAISDNLALDRELRLMKNDVDAKVDISSLDGIKTKEIDWKDLMPKEEVVIDALAMLVPEDQHVLICPSLEDMNKIVSLIEKEGSPLAQSFTVRNPFRTLPSRYKKQLGLNFPAAFARLVPVKSVAVTGFDPFFPTGTDVAVLLETDKPEMLFKMLDEMIKTPDKNIAIVGKVIVIANSKRQLARIHEVHTGKIKSLGSLDEYKFFRHRYPVAEKRTGFVFLSDACIRRWGGPQMRIAASRRTKSIAALNYLTARSISKEKVMKLNTDQQFLLGDVLSNEGVIESKKMGSLHFMTPTIDMQMDKVTQTEADAYKRWKRGYESGWKVFDPIGFSFQIDDDTKEFDLTVMPLTVNNEYEYFIKIVGKSVLSKGARILEDKDVMTMSVAIDKNGEMLGQMNTSLSAMIPGIKVQPLSWLGSSITFFAEKDARWKLLEDSKFEDFILSSPIGLRVEHTSQIKLASFLLAMRGTAAAVAPGALKWEAREYGDVIYSAVSSEEDLGIDAELKIYYVITKNMLIITLREDVIKREIDRVNLKVEPKLALSPLQKNADHFYLKSTSGMLTALSSPDGRSLADMRRRQSYRAIPILNEWKRRFENVKPVMIHFTKFGEDIFCPGGKGYVWNKEEMTMESVVYGHPAKPRKVEEDGALMDVFGELETAMKFEHDGLRLKLKLTRSGAQ
jgi:hypothetical protein